MENVNFKALQFETDFYTCVTSQVVQAVCNSITFLNNGTTTAIIENVTLQPNQSLTITGNAGEITNQRFFVNFGNSTEGNSLAVIRKRYINL